MSFGFQNLISVQFLITANQNFQWFPHSIRRCPKTDHWCKFGVNQSYTSQYIMLTAFQDGHCLYGVRVG